MKGKQAWGTIVQTKVSQPPVITVEDLTEKIKEVEVFRALGEDFVMADSKGATNGRMLVRTPFC